MPRPVVANGKPSKLLGSREVSKSQSFLRNLCQLTPALTKVDPGGGLSAHQDVFQRERPGKEAEGRKEESKHETGKLTLGGKRALIT